MIKQYLDISTTHLTESTMNNLDDTYPFCFGYEEGTFISVPHDEDTLNYYYNNLPEDLYKLMLYAIKNNISLIRLDRDADIFDDLPIYNWN